MRACYWSLKMENKRRSQKLRFSLFFTNPFLPFISQMLLYIRSHHGRRHCGRRVLVFLPDS